MRSATRFSIGDVLRAAAQESRGSDALSGGHDRASRLVDWRDTQAASRGSTRSPARRTPPGGLTRGSVAGGRRLLAAAPVTRPPRLAQGELPSGQPVAWVFHIPLRHLPMVGTRGTTGP